MKPKMKPPIRVKLERGELRLDKPVRRICPHHGHELAWEGEEGEIEVRMLDPEGPFDGPPTGPSGSRIRKLRRGLPLGRRFQYEVALWKGGAIIGKALGTLWTYGEDDGETYDVEIIVKDGVIDVDYDHRKVDRCRGDRVRWTCKHGRFEVRFPDKSPFAAPAYSGSKSLPKASDKCRPDADLGAYKYDITVWPEGGGAPLKLDPIVDVEDGGDE